MGTASTVTARLLEPFRHR